MRSNKLFFSIFLVLYFIAGLSLLITGSVAHRHAKQYADITGYSLTSGAGFVIALGVIILLLSVVGYIGAYKNRLGLLKLFLGSLAIVLLLQLIAAIVAFTLRDRVEDQLRTKLLHSLPDNGTTTGVLVSEWDLLQSSSKCCGVDRFNDWMQYAKHDKPPQSCCILADCSETPSGGSKYYADGCYGSARNLFFRYSKALGGVSIFFFFVEIAGLVLASLLLRDLKSNYGSV